MSGRAILQPVSAMVLLTIGVGITLYVQRVAEMRERRIHPQAVASAAQIWHS